MKKQKTVALKTGNRMKRVEGRFKGVYSKTCGALTLAVCVRRLDSVAKPLPQMVQWNGRFLARSTWASWFRRCCCRLDNCMKARPHSAKWHLYGRSPADEMKNKKTLSKQYQRVYLYYLYNTNKNIVSHCATDCNSSINVLEGSEKKIRKKCHHNRLPTRIIIRTRGRFICKYTRVLVVPNNNNIRTSKHTLT